MFDPMTNASPSGVHCKVKTGFKKEFARVSKVTFVGSPITGKVGFWEPQVLRNFMRGINIQKYRKDSNVKDGHSITTYVPTRREPATARSDVSNVSCSPWRNPGYANFRKVTLTRKKQNEENFGHKQSNR